MRTTPGLEAHAETRIGRRAENDDRALLRVDIGLFAVADGLCGAPGSALASDLALAALEHAFGAVAAESYDAAPAVLGARLREAVRTASGAVHARRSGRLVAMATTMAAVAFGARHVAVAQVGDCRVYRHRRGRFEAMTEDHTIGALLGAHGVAPALCASYGHLVTRALGERADQLDVDLRVEPRAAADRYLLCTDGVSEVTPAETMAALVARLRPARAAFALVEGALRLGARDNVTALAVAPRRAPRERPASSRDPSARRRR